MPPDRLRSIVSMFGGGAHYVEILDAICQHDVEIVFGHPNPSIYEANYLVPIPAADEAFESGVTVATSRELHDAAVRHEMFRATVLSKEQNYAQSINDLPVLVVVAAGFCVPAQFFVHPPKCGYAR